MACSQSKMSILVISTPQGSSLKLPDFIEFDDSVEFEAWIKVRTASLADVGQYRLDVREVNQIS